MSKNETNIKLEDQEDFDLVFLGSVQEETKGFGFTGPIEPRDFDKTYDVIEIDSMP